MENKECKYDELSMYFGDDYKVNERITVHQPTIGEIVEWGEQRYFSMINSLCSIPSDMKSFLYDNGIDWQEISDFEFFMIMCKPYTVEETSIILGDIDLSKMGLYVDNTTGESVLYNQEIGLSIDEDTFNKMIGYIRKFNNIIPVVEKAINERTKLALIELERQKINENKNKHFTSFLKPLISSALNNSGFKYKKNELREVGLYEFMDSIQRLQIIISTTALMHGMYSGNVDVSKIKKKEFNWMRELDSDARSGENLRIPSDKQQSQ